MGVSRKGNRSHRVKLVFLAVLLVSVAAFAGSIRLGAVPAKLNDVALGDSLAAGYAPNGTLGKGYADYVADDLRAAGLLAQFDKRYAVPGFTTQDQLQELRENKHVDLPGNRDSLGIQKRLSQADLVTLDIGANDLLDTLRIDWQQGTVSVDPDTVKRVTAQVEDNVKKILRQIKTLAPRAQVCLLGYYNPFWGLPQGEQAPLRAALARLNSALSTAASSEGVTFVSTEGAIAADPQRYLPDLFDIHPNAAGYRLLGKLVWHAMQAKLPGKVWPGRQVAENLGDNGMRIGGTDRFATAGLIAQATYPGRVPAVILAAGDNWPDALTGSVLSHKYHAPILLVGKGPAQAQPALNYIGAHLAKSGSVYILGGTSAVGPEAERELARSGIPQADIIRLGGSDRTATALKIDENLNPSGGGMAFVVTNAGYADALTVAAYAAAQGCPILPVPSDSLPGPVRDYLAALKPAKIIIVGGEGAVSAEVAQELKTLAGTVVRYGGTDRYATSRALLTALYPDSPGGVCLVTGRNYPDALAGSAYAGFWDEPLVLLPDRLDRDTRNFLHKFQGLPYTIFGGAGAVSRQNAVLVQAELEG
ncbi:GDSL-like Lipase/Acylhydrolase family [Acididesulfobacillus acetoxydans]|uniref:Bacterial group 1 Ig-like protein n=1 Tax=Acididesulfobacillus acetoxydans TaxID=1561005 RepID=A0A8S0XCA5_9FIRM|nr:cell wall-binding repeat-containing protein [Acididesulfobacillus acetoxydans]CAA7602236.1 GDSL-like Lipase/Acylhydrolase family [Acididesulfobacillus acetoxydans]CEJ07546.1 Bacterial group 1 Ig-like protein [Acididesulfobacillus acetoxydans]